MNEVEKISLNRAKNFLLGIDETTLNNKIVNALLIEGVLIKGKYGIRLKYDIYEDIFFEYFFDQELISSKGDYNVFFNNIGQIGRSIYRRYQIWISNKLFAIDDKEEIIYNLLFSEFLPDEWKKQTKIGIVKSDYCNYFFDKYEDDLLEKELINEYLKIINMYSYDINVCKSNYVYKKIDLIPVGRGRKSIIEIIKNNDLYKKNLLNRNRVIKLCIDCSRQEESMNDKSLMNNICEIIEYYIESDISNSLISSYKKSEYISQSMLCLFNLANYSKKWLSNFIKQLTIDINSDDEEKNIFAEDMCKWTFENCCPILVKELACELFELANTYWIDSRRESKKELFYRDIESLERLYGLNKFAEEYNFDYCSTFSNTFLYNIFRVNFIEAFHWAIIFINNGVSNYVINSENYTKITIKFDNNDEKT